MGLATMEKLQIEAQVTALLNEIGYRFDQDDYIDIVALVKQFGFIVGNAELDDKEDGFLAIRPSKLSQTGDHIQSDKIIGVNSKRSVELKRFIIAHEFAHSMLHYKTGSIYLHRENRKGKGDCENDADYFAAALLMPREPFRRLYCQLKNENLLDTAICFRLASIFKVPLDSVTRRVPEVFSDLHTEGGT